MKRKLNTVAHWMKLADDAANDLAITYLALKKIARGDLTGKGAQRIARQAIKKMP
jgi:lipoate synthase